MTSMTRRLGKLALDPDRLAEDVGRSDRFRFSDAYSEFTCGSWKGSALCNGTGDLYDTLIVDYDGPFQLTEHGRQMPYVMEVVRENFRAEAMRFARLGRITPGSVMVPHRDYMELKQELVRIHVPLHTSERCFSSEDETVYQMREGDVWFIDASHPHSAVSFFEEDRTHLILDFIAPSVESVLRFEPDPVLPGAQFAGADVAREPLTPAQRQALLGLGEVIGAHNYRDVLALIIKQYFVSAMSVTDIFDLACEVARAGEQEDAFKKLDWLRVHALISRLD